MGFHQLETLGGDIAKPQVLLDLFMKDVYTPS
jgi:hypothetical protein